ncbi:meiotic recombination [Tilletia horrida]|nr:meiotic recombination [Tilletia horrida]
MSASPPPSSQIDEDAHLFDDAENDPDCVRIMLATDNHIGYQEKDPVRGQDSINTFKEILQLAVDNNVDFILLGGDLFHENKPSRVALHNVIALLREYTMGDRPVSVELRSDAGNGYKEGFSFPSVNYADENINVGIPVFSIHGNHDDPQGSGPAGSLSALDILSAAGLITYFGRTDLPSDDAAAGESASRTAAADEAEAGIRLKPILLQKGRTKLALYGLGNVRDERLHFELRANRVRLQRPVEDTEDWFNLLVLHQNRAKHNQKAAVPEGLFDDSTHLVIWGHEHECRIEPELVAGKDYCISQPGSSIATSLSPGETMEKHVALLMIKDQKYTLKPIKLKTVRPFIMDELNLETVLQQKKIKFDNRDGITKVLRDKVNDLVAQSIEDWNIEHAEDDPRPKRMLPLIRLRVIYTNQVVGNPVRFGQEFAGKVANPKEVLQFTKKSEKSKKPDGDGDDSMFDLDDREIVAAERLERIRIGTILEKLLEHQSMQILNPKEMQDAVLNYAEKDHSLETYLALLRNNLNGAGIQNEDDINARIEDIRQQRRDEDEDEEEHDEAAVGGEASSSKARKPAASSSNNRKRAGTPDSMLQDMDVDDEGEMSDNFSEPEAPRAAAKGKGKAKAKPKSASPARKKKVVQVVSDDEAVSEEEPPPPQKSSRASVLSQIGKKAPASRAPAKKATATAKNSKMTQSQLNFDSGPARASGARGRTAAKKAQTRISNSLHENDDEEDEDVDVIEDSEDDDDDGETYRPQKGSSTRNKQSSAVIGIGDSDSDEAPPPKKRASSAATKGRSRR